MILILIVIVIINLFILYQKNTTFESSGYTCGANQKPPVDYRGVGITKDRGFKGGQTVYLAFDGDVEKSKQILEILKEYAFPYINLNFQIGRYNDSTITIKTDPSASPTATISGNTTGIGTKTPIITIYRMTQGVILHEFGHAMGMFHEHQNPAPNNPIQWNKDQVYAHYVTKQNWKKEAVDAQIINRRDKAKSLYTNWDQNSIMNYSIRPGFTAAPVQTFIGQEYSDGDKNWFKMKFGPKLNK